MPNHRRNHRRSKTSEPQAAGPLTDASNVQRPRNVQRTAKPLPAAAAPHPLPPAAAAAPQPLPPSPAAEALPGLEEDSLPPNPHSQLPLVRGSSRGEEGFFGNAFGDSCLR